MKISVSTYSFSQLLNSGELNQFSCIAKAKELGFDAVEFVDILPHDGSSERDYAKRLGQEVRRQGLEVSNFTFGADFLNAAGGAKAEIARVKERIELAVELGATSVRHDATIGLPAGKGYRSFDSVLPILSDACRQITEYAATLGVRTMVENHGQFCQESSRVEKLVAAVDHPNFGLLADMGNFLCADEDPTLAFGRIAPYAFYAHAKDFHFKSGSGDNPGPGFFTTRAGNYLRGAIIGHGCVPVRQCLSVLKANGYQGMIAVEFEGLEDCLTGVRLGLDNLRRFAQQAGL